MNLTLKLKKNKGNIVTAPVNIKKTEVNES